MPEVMDQLEQERGICRECKIERGYRPILDYVKLCQRHATMGAQWRPVETAPKDGTTVLLVWKWDSGVHKGVNVIMAHWGCRAHEHQSRHHDCPNEPDCRMNWGAYAGDFTHWMPLPDPPTTD